MKRVITALALLGTSIPIVSKRVQKRSTQKKYGALAEIWKKRYGHLCGAPGKVEYDDSDGAWYFSHRISSFRLSNYLPYNLTEARIEWLDSAKQEIAVQSDSTTPLHVGESALFAAQYEMVKPFLTVKEQNEALILGICFFSSKKFTSLQRKLMFYTLISVLNKKTKSN